MLLRLVVVVAIVTAAAVVGAWWRARDGRIRRGDGFFTAAQLAAVGLTQISRTGAAVLLGSPTCAPCTTVKQVLGEVREQRPAFDWTYVDAGDHLDLADDHRVMRVPTLFVVDRRGRILARTSGVPARQDLVAVLDREQATLDRVP